MGRLRTNFLLTLIALSVITSLSLPVRAQDQRAVISVDYSAAVPLGATRDYTRNASSRGLGFETRFYGWGFFSGVAASWQIFREERQSPSTITGAKFEALTTSLVPILATGHYVWSSGRLQPFVGGGIGAMLNKRTLESLGEQVVDKEWYTAVSGDGGMYYTVGDGVGLMARARYVGGFKRGKTAPQMLQFSMGIIFIY
jgi:hypothetical protein